MVIGDGYNGHELIATTGDGVFGNHYSGQFCISNHHLPTPISPILIMVTNSRKVGDWSIMRLRYHDHINPGVKSCWRGSIVGNVANSRMSVSLRCTWLSSKHISLYVVSGYSSYRQVGSPPLAEWGYISFSNPGPIRNHSTLDYSNPSDNCL